MNYIVAVAGSFVINLSKTAGLSSKFAFYWKLGAGKRFDLYFLDIFMDGVSGIDTARQIRSNDYNALIVFASTSDDFYRESYDLFAFHYLIKPITSDKLIPVI